MGGAAILLNALLVTVVIELIPGAEISGLAEGVVVTIGLTVLTALFGALLAIGDDEAWQRNVVGRSLRRSAGRTSSDVPGMLLLEIDGLAHEVAVRALRDGTMPNLARWVASGSHRLERWETDLSSQTGACQAGILHGNNDDCRPSAGGRKRPASRSSPTTRATPPSSSGATPTGTACCTPMAPAGPTSSPATRRTRC